MMEYVDLKGFEEFIRERDLVPEAHRTFYLNWVRRFLRAEFSANELSAKDKVECFSDQLARDDSVKEWQLRQALQAVSLFLDVYLREGTGHQDQGTRGAGKMPAGQERNRQDVGDTKCGDDGATPSKEEAMAQMKKLLRLRHYAYSTEQTYEEWVGRYFKYADRQALAWIEPGSIRAFLSYLALQRKVAASTQNQAFSSLLFLFRETLKIEVPDMNAVRAKRGPKLPVVLSVDEVKGLFSHTDGTAGLMLRLIYGGGLRVSEAMRLRVQDLDFKNDLLFIRCGKGDKDRTTLLPERLVPELKTHLVEVRKLHEQDLAKGFGAVYLPGALEHKYPNAPQEWKWQYVFPARNLSVDPRSGKTRRHHVSDKGVQSALHRAVREADIQKHATVHTLRHSFATHLLLAGTNIREVQELLGHKNVETTMIYTHVVREMGNKPQSPLDAL
jgi:integron integrase